MKIILWFIYDIIFSMMLTSVVTGMMLFNIIIYKWYWVTIFSLLFVYFAYRILYYSKDEPKLFTSVKADLESADSRLDLNLTYIPLFGFVCVFALLNQQFYFLENGNYSIDTTQVWFLDSRLDFLFYAYDNLVRASLLDLFETYNLHISRISSINILITTFLFAYKTFLSIFFLRVLINILNSLKKYANFKRS